VKLANPASWAPPPRILLAASVLVLSVSTVLAVLGAFHNGITTDEPVHVMRLRNFFDTGWYALDWDYVGTHPGADDTNTYVYGPVAMLLLHSWSVLWGVEGWSQVATTPHAYDIRHLGVVMIGLLGLAATAAIGRTVLRSWRWGLVAAGALAAIPMWTGHEMVNIKDVPVATGHTLVTLGLLCFVRSSPPDLRMRVARAGCLGAGLVLTLGTRPGMWSGLLAVLVVTVAGIAVAGRERRDALRPLGELAITCAAAAVTLVSIYPKVFDSPLRALLRTTENSSNFRDGAAPDRLYVPHHLAQEMPTLLLIFAVVGLVVGGVLVCRQWRCDPVPAARISLVAVQAVTLPIVAVVLGSDLYDGLRQLLFAIPAMAVLAAYGMAWWLSRPVSHRTGAVLAVAAAAALALPMIDQITLQPYQTVYVNLATDLTDGSSVAADRRTGTDSWRISIPELIDGMDLDRRLLCKTAADKASNVSYSFYPLAGGGEEYSTRRSLDCREESTGPLAPERLPLNRIDDDHSYDAVFLKRLPANCAPLNEVTRWRHGFEVVLTALGRCTVDVPVLRPAGVSVHGPALASGDPDDLWRFAVDGWLQWPRQRVLTAPGPRAGIAFRTDSTCSNAGCTVVVEGGHVPADLVVRIGSEEAVLVRATDGTIRVPVAVKQAAGDDGIWLTFTRSAGGNLGMQLTGLRMESKKGLR
jgi:hypothetical protein